MGSKSRPTETGGPIFILFRMVGNVLHNGVGDPFIQGWYLLGLPKSQIRGEVKFILPFDMWKLIKRSNSEVLSLFGQLIVVRFCYISLYSEKLYLNCVTSFETQRPLLQTQKI